MSAREHDRESEPESSPARASHALTVTLPAVAEPELVGVRELMIVVDGVPGERRAVSPDAIDVEVGTYPEESDIAAIVSEVAKDGTGRRDVAELHLVVAAGARAEDAEAPGVVMAAGGEGEHKGRGKGKDKDKGK